MSTSLSSEVAAKPTPTIPRFLYNALIGALCSIGLAAVWRLAAALGLADPPSARAVVGAFLPVLVDVGHFVSFNLGHNLPFVLLAGGVLVAFELAFRRKVAVGESPAPTVTLFKATSLLLGLFTMAISLHGMLAASSAQGQDPKALIGNLYFKFGLWVLTAVLMILRYIAFEARQVPGPPPTSHE